MQTIHLTNKNTQEAVDAAAAVLSAGGLVVYPTETMYGVGVDATNPDAVSKVLSYKNRPAGKAISVVVADQSAAEKLVELSDDARAAYQTFLPGPVTVISKSRGIVDARLESELQTLGIRISSYSFVQELAATFAQPFTATSANASGGAQPYSIEKLLASLSPQQIAKIDLIIDAGELPHNEPSTVIDTTSDVQRVVRAGVLALGEPIQTHSPEETIHVAAGIVKTYEHAISEKPLIFALEGDMGMGKTQFAKGVAQALSVKGIVSSPTYTLMKEYVGTVDEKQVQFVHIDCWRTQSITADELGLREYLKPRTVIVIEWAQPLMSWLRELGTEAVVQRIRFTATSKNDRSLQVVAI